MSFLQEGFLVRPLLVLVEVSSSLIRNPISMIPDITLVGPNLFFIYLWKASHNTFLRVIWVQPLQRKAKEDPCIVEGRRSIQTKSQHNKANIPLQAGH